MKIPFFKTKQQKHFDQFLAKWPLTEEYLNFLSKVPAGGKVVKAEDFVNYLRVFDNQSLMSAQAGYSFNPITKTAIEKWPESYLVIARDSGDHYVIDLSKPNSEVLISESGTGDWNFKVYAESIEEFGKKIGVE